jgi:type I restriction enzyme M protein
MLSLDLRSKIDKLWNTFFANGLADPLTAIEQINYLIFMKRLDELDRQNVIKSQRVSSFEYKSIFDGVYKKDERDEGINKSLLRWSHWRELPAEEMFSFVQWTVFSFLKSLDGSNGYADNLSDAVFMIPNAGFHRGRPKNHGKKRRYCWGYLRISLEWDFFRWKRLSIQNPTTYHSNDGRHRESYQKW